MSSLTSSSSCVCLFLNDRILAGAGYGFLATTVYTVEVVSKEARGSILVFAGVTRYEPCSPYNLYIQL